MLLDENDLVAVELKTKEKTAATTGIKAKEIYSCCYYFSVT